MRIASYLIAVFLVLGGAHSAFCSDRNQPDVAAVSLSAEAAIELRADILAKGISQKRHIYLENVLDDTVTINKIRIPKSKAIEMLLSTYGTMKITVAQERHQISSRKANPNMVLTHIDMIDANAAKINLYARLPNKIHSSPKDKKLIRIEVSFARSNKTWKITSLSCIEN